jgi:hypothetical protein
MAGTLASATANAAAALSLKAVKMFTSWCEVDESAAPRTSEGLVCVRNPWYFVGLLRRRQTACGIRKLGIFGAALVQ